MTKRPRSFCSETAAKPEQGLALLQLVVLSSQLGHGSDPAGLCRRRGCRPTPAPARPSTRDRRPSEICPVPFAAQSDPQSVLYGIGGNRSVVSVDQRLLVDLLVCDGALWR